MSERLDRVDRVAPWLLAVVTFATCTAFMPDYPTEWDSIQLTFGVDRFDITHGSPHPPGYWLYVFLGRVVRWLTPWSAATSLSVIAAAAAGATVALTYVVGRRFGGPWLGGAAAAALFTSPYLLFYGATVNTYTFDALIAVGLVLLASQARPGSWHGWGAAGVLGLGAGLRQTTLLVLGPLVACAVVALVRSLRQALAVVVAGAGGLAAWMVPMLVEQPGGWSRYREFSDEYLAPALERTSILYGAPRTGIVNNLGQATGYTLATLLVLLPVAAFGVALFAWDGRRRAAPAAGVDTPRPWWRVGCPPLSLLLWLSVLVPVAFVLLVHFGKAGYVLSYLPALVLLLLWPASRLRGAPLVVVSALLVVACAVNVQRFTSAAGIIPGAVLNEPSLWFTQERHGAPYRLTKPLMDQTDRETRSYLALREEFDPDRDVLVYVAMDGGHRFRHAGYTMPDVLMHYVEPGVRRYYQTDRTLFYVNDSTVPVPEGGRAVWVLDVPFPETLAMEEQGLVMRHTLATGPTVWVTEPGVTMFGVTVVER
ncbi:MAG: hypothetical protein KY443_07920 [Actinobacteria bacterium]|nr:hypothetical protein [Actinomycetota bacterium]